MLTINDLDIPFGIVSVDGDEVMHISSSTRSVVPHSVYLGPKKKWLYFKTHTAIHEIRPGLFEAKDVHGVSHHIRLKTALSASDIKKRKLDALINPVAPDTQ